MVEKKHCGIISAITFGGGWSVISMGLFIFSLVLYIILNNNGDTSVMKDLLLTYCILQAISFLVTMVNNICLYCTLICSRCDSDDSKVVKVITFFLNLPMVVTLIIGLIVCVSEIVIAGRISYNFFAGPWTSNFVSYGTMLVFVIIIMVIHGFQVLIFGIAIVLIGLIIFLLLVVVGIGSLVLMVNAVLIN